MQPGKIKRGDIVMLVAAIVVVLALVIWAVHPLRDSAVWSNTVIAVSFDWTRFSTYDRKHAQS